MLHGCRCQEGIPWKVAEFLSSLPPSGGVEGSGGVKGKDRARDREVSVVVSACLHGKQTTHLCTYIV